MHVRNRFGPDSQPAPGGPGPGGGRGTQARSARTRAALLESAARGLSRYGYGNLVLAQVAADAGFTRGALYHQFKDKQELTLAALGWVLDTWQEEVGDAVDREPDPVAALLTLARGHAVFCRREVARIAIALRLEFTGQDHPVGVAVERAYDVLVEHCVRFIDSGRAAGALPPGPPTRTLALAFVGALEGTVVALAGQAPYDELLAEHAVTGVLGLSPATGSRS
ncbi:TetR/AcrR family transcriptional regulator [Streptomyces sp. NPDC006798]|uniref:TetR/AcrR family transcriptional regulator n=1 Tax=Streptomyces sp. NPDC006798 TaxID=3155462 RepID=UPI0033C9BE11